MENENIDYQDLIKENIFIAKNINNLPEKQKKIVIELLQKRQKIKIKNGFFAELKLKKIDIKIEKIREEFNEEKKI